MVIARAGLCRLVVSVLIASGAGTLPSFAQEPDASPDRPAVPLVLPADYAIGPDDALSVLVWREKELSMDVVVRPDGHITLPLLNDIQASGLRPEQLRTRIQEKLKAFVKDPIVTVIVKQVNSRKVFITGRVAKPGAYALMSPLRVMDVIALAGGLLPAADSRHLSVLRTEPEGRVALPVDYQKVIRGEALWQDVLLRPGDSIVVP